MCVNNLSKVALDLNPRPFSRKSNALTTAPPSHTSSWFSLLLIITIFMVTSRGRIHLQILTYISAFPGGRFNVQPRGLLIRNISQADNGDYTCRAEVEAEGRYDERKISVVVHSMYIYHEN